MSTYLLEIINFGNDNSLYSHLSATAFEIADTGETIKTLHFGVYPTTHLNREDQIARARKEDSTISAMACDSSDYSQIIHGKETSDIPLFIVTPNTKEKLLN